ncbi:hypothetical protein [uncultured Shimia sp.]|uniref:hypothetical protein n=1 Tax=uncultured Shimia sp. TaxID=573152 RepID=UPI002615271E|nr:hypothetical protein [uncultured Shimia sp.]
MKPISILTVVAMCLASPAAAEFSLSFKGWDNIPLCTSGNPNTVGNPEFTLKGVPDGTTTVQFQPKDLDVPNYNHGGSKKLKITKDGKVPAGTFSYKSPCPPSGSHTYQWTATARKGGKKLATAMAQRKYPK